MDASSFGFPGNTEGVFDSGYKENAGISASVLGNALTVRLVQRNGASPSIASPVKMAFYNSSLSTYKVAKLISSLTITAPSGASLGTVNNQAARIWVLLVKDGENYRLGLFNSLSGLNIASLIDNSLTSTTTMSAGATSAQTIYTDMAVTSGYYRILGYIEITEATAGTWATAPSQIIFWQPGMRLPGYTIQSNSSFDGAVATGATAIPYDDTIPQITEGTQFMSLAITPTFAGNIINIQHVGVYTSGGSATIALFQDSTANALAAISINAGAGGVLVASIMHAMVSAITSATTFRIRAGNDGATTVGFNGTTGGLRRLGGISASRLIISEVMV